MNESNLTPVQEADIQRIMKEQAARQRQATSPILIKPPIQVVQPAQSQEVGVPTELLPTKPQMTTTQADQILNDMNIQAIIDVNKSKLEDARLTNIVNDRAEREPLPFIVEQAMEGDYLVVNKNIKIRKMKAIDLTIFKLIESPFYKLIMGDVNGDDQNAMKTLFPNEELLFQVVHQFTHPAADVYKAVKAGIESYKELVIIEVGEKYTPAELVEIVQVVLEHIGMVDRARVGFEGPTSDDKKKQLT